MQDLTLNTISIGLLFILGFAAALKAVYSGLKDGIENLLDDKFKGIDDKIDKLDKKLNDVEVGSCKNYIVAYIADMERGGIPDEIERQRFWDAYEVYIEDGGNSYIQDRVKKLQKEGKL